MKGSSRAARCGVYSSWLALSSKSDSRLCCDADNEESMGEPGNEESNVTAPGKTGDEGRLLLPPANGGMEFESVGDPAGTDVSHVPDKCVTRGGEDTIGLAIISLISGGRRLPSEPREGSGLAHAPRFDILLSSASCGARLRNFGKICELLLPPADSFSISRYLESSL